MGALTGSSANVNNNGNAFERLGKYLRQFEFVYKSTPIFPLVVFCAGGCFHKGECGYYQGICMNGGDKGCVNTLFTSENNIPGMKLASLLFREDYETWTEEEMIPLMLKVAEDSIKFFGGK